MATGRPVRISILADARDAVSGLKQTETAAGRLSNRFSKFRAPAAAALGALALGAKTAISAASDLSEVSSKTDVIFGKQSDAIKDFASNAASSLGQSKTAALEAATTFGLIGQKAGLSGTETAKFSTQFTGLASDMASFNNTTPEEAVQAIGAAMRGESEPIRKYGVMLDDATLKARAMKMGLIQTTKQALTPQQKALAASQEILAQTSKAQGDFARTSDGAANKQRILAAQTENVKAKLGSSLLPAYQSVLQVVGKFATWAEQHPAQLQVLIGVIGAVAVAVLAMSVVSKVAAAAQTAMRVATTTATAAQWALNVAMRANPIGLVVTVVMVLVGALILAYKKSETFRNIVNKAFSVVSGAVRGFLQILGTLKSKVVAVFATAISWLRNAGGNIVRGLWNGVHSLFVWIKDKVATIKNKVTDALSGAGTLLLEKGKDIVRGLWEGVKEMASWIREKVSGFINKYVVEPIQSALEIFSPSRLMRKFGRFTAMGLAIGMDDDRARVKKSAAGLALAAVSGFGGQSLALDAKAALEMSNSLASQRNRIEVTLAAEEMSALEHGRKTQMVLDVYNKAGGRRRA